MREALSLGTRTIFTLRREAPPCGAAPAAPHWAAASYCDRSPSRRPARQLRRPRASSPPEPGIRPRRCLGASFLQAPSHGPRQENAARSELTESANASEAPSSRPRGPNCRGHGTVPPAAPRLGAHEHGASRAGALPSAARAGDAPHRQAAGCASSWHSHFSGLGRRPPLHPVPSQERT